ncbi:Protein kinase-like domain protein [Cordyceps fumosorosea ARSEF 2679]|uniref:Protein kinase-like domain protein n=1 Tax=Cordyceps fumosorosea (strain ARSEF 2679) TaxID=1081104 RepID=A0A168DYK7_CORFA|nr:Protein kinase-like domain protein [Cordyceps fumosorosea ARSEF 2679]OAA73160.1 Protein kinase-like domain protein [Cordyceps fumosorosea ARSEF 2679]
MSSQDSSNSSSTVPIAELPSLSTAPTPHSNNDEQVVFHHGAKRPCFGLLTVPAAQEVQAGEEEAEDEEAEDEEAEDEEVEDEEAEDEEAEDKEADAEEVGEKKAGEEEPQLPALRPEDNSSPLDLSPLPLHASPISSSSLTEYGAAEDAAADKEREVEEMLLRSLALMTVTEKTLPENVRAAVSVPKSGDPSGVYKGGLEVGTESTERTESGLSPDLFPLVGYGTEDSLLPNQTQLLGFGSEGGPAPDLSQLLGYGTEGSLLPNQAQLLGDGTEGGSWIDQFGLLGDSTEGGNSEQRKKWNIVQGSAIIGFDLHMQAETQAEMPAATQYWCSFVFDPASDSVIARNQGNGEISLYALHVNTETPAVRREFYRSLKPDHHTRISPGYWLVTADHTTDQNCWAEVRLLPRKFRCIYTQVVLPASKRPRPDDDDSQAITDIGQSSALGAMAKENPMLIPQTTRIHVLSPVLSLEAKVEAKNTYTLDCHRYIVGPHGTRIIFLATHSGYHEYEERVAVKLIRGNSPDDVATLAKRWTKEVLFHTLLHDPSIVKYLGSDSRFLAIFTEYLPYDGLADTSPNGMFKGSAEDAERVLKDISSVLVYLEAEGILHNDIKPGNILYDKQRGAVLIDFGLASYVGDGDLSGGTLPYVPPEVEAKQVRGREDTRSRCPKSEIYSLGVTMLYLLRKTDLPDMNRKKFVWKMFSGSLKYQKWKAEVTTMAESIPGRIGSIVRRMLAESPQDRISAQEILDELERK